MPTKPKSTQHLMLKPKAPKAKPNQQELGSTFHVKWSYRFTPLHDGCHDCVIQLVVPMKKGRFQSRLVVGIDPLDNKIRFISIPPRISANLTRALLEKVIHESRGFQVQYSSSESNHRSAALKFVTSLKILIQKYFP